MLVHTMTLPEMVADARRDYKALWNKVNALLPGMRRIHLKARGETITHLVPWTSPRKNHWLLHFSLRKAGPLMHPLVYSYDAKGRLFGLIVTPTGSSYCIDNHLIQRYGSASTPRPIRWTACRASSTRTSSTPPRPSTSAAPACARCAWA